MKNIVKYLPVGFNSLEKNVKPYSFFRVILGPFFYYGWMNVVI